MKWIKCTDSLPIYKECVVFYPKKLDFWLYGLFIDDEFVCREDGSYADDSFKPEEVSYWAEITEPPKEE